MPVSRPRQNRVTPFGTIEATPHRGQLMGNRGDLHAPDGTLGRLWKSRRWISCILDLDGWTIPMDTPGHYYKLFFHDETVALAAGHRPCGQCRPEALGAFITAWKLAHGMSRSDWIAVKDIDGEMHQARIRERRFRLRANLAELPCGTFVWKPELDCRPLLVFEGQLVPWEHGGFGPPIERTAAGGEVKVLTPSPMVSVLREGYAPILPPNLQRVAKP